MTESANQQRLPRSFNLQRIGRAIAARCALVMCLLGLIMAWVFQMAQQHVQAELARWNLYGTLLVAELNARNSADRVLDPNNPPDMEFTVGSGQRLRMTWMLVADQAGTILGEAGVFTDAQRQLIEQKLPVLQSRFLAPDKTLLPDAGRARVVAQLPEENQTILAVAVSNASEPLRILAGAVTEHPTDTDPRLLILLGIGALAWMLLSAALLRRAIDRTLTQPAIQLAAMSGIGPGIMGDQAPSVVSIAVTEQSHPIHRLIALVDAARQRCGAREAELRRRLALSRISQTSPAQE